MLTILKIPLYLLHGPDETVPVAEILDAIQILFEEGRFEKVKVFCHSSLFDT